MMLKTCLFIILFGSSLAYGALEVTCEGGGHKLLIHSTALTQMTVSLNGETVTADGYLGEDEIDLVARFPRQGEMTLYGMIGRNHTSSYLFLKGKRIPVYCR